MGEHNPYQLDAKVQAELQDILDRLPPLTPEQLDRVCETLTAIRLRGEES